MSASFALSQGIPEVRMECGVEALTREADPLLVARHPRSQDGVQAHGGPEDGCGAARHRPKAKWSAG